MTDLYYNARRRTGWEMIREGWGGVGWLLNIIIIYNLT